MPRGAAASEEAKALLLVTAVPRCRGGVAGRGPVGVADDSHAAWAWANEVPLQVGAAEGVSQEGAWQRTVARE